MGPHADPHPLYCAWDDRQKSLISESEFKKDLERNSLDLKQLRRWLPGRSISFHRMNGSMATR